MPLAVAPLCESPNAAVRPSTLPKTKTTHHYHKHLTTCRYRDDLGHAIANFARVVPDGLLVFFPAYSLLTACLDHWKASTGSTGE